MSYLLNNHKIGSNFIQYDEWTGSTNSGTPTTIKTYTIDNNTSYAFRIDLSARNTNNVECWSGTYVGTTYRSGTAVVIGGTGGMTSLVRENVNPDPDIILIPVGNNLQIQLSSGSGSTDVYN